MTASALYEGTVWHERRVPRRHAFRNRVGYLYLDLDELPELLRRRWLWSDRRPNLAWFRRADYLGPRERPLAEAARDRVEAELGRRPGGPVRLFTQVRVLGFVFNPVSFYFCHGADGALDAVVAEITNTPWGERHAYVLDASGGGERFTWRFDKAFHVSPFHDMGQVYEWTFSRPGERLDVHMRNLEHGEEVFSSGLSCTRRPLDAAGCSRLLLRYPLQTFFVPLAIYWHAARLFLKRTPFFVHPRKRPATDGAQ